MVKCIGIRQKHRVMEQESRSILRIRRKIDYSQEDLK